jgi:hypothetical protein
VTKDGAKSARDVDLEWQILQKLDPEAAKRIQTGAEQEAEKAKNAS